MNEVDPRVESAATWRVIKKLKASGARSRTGLVDVRDAIRNLLKARTALI
jgi:hypothetical protein